MVDIHSVSCQYPVDVSSTGHRLVIDWLSTKERGIYKI